MKVLVDEMPSHPDECIFSDSDWDYETDEKVYQCKLSESGCNYPNCEYLSEFAKPETPKKYYDLYLNGYIKSAWLSDHGVSECKLRGFRVVPHPSKEDHR